MYSSMQSFEMGHQYRVFKMLCQPSADTVLEVLIFLVSRHMIIGDTSAFEDFVSIVSIALLFAIKKYIQIPAGGRKEKSIFSTCRNEMGDENPMEKNREKYMREPYGKPRRHMP